MNVRITNLECEQFSITNSVKNLGATLEKNNSAIIHCMETLDSLNKRVNMLEKAPNLSPITESSYTIEVNSKEN